MATTFKPIFLHLLLSLTFLNLSTSLPSLLRNPLSLSLTQPASPQNGASSPPIPVNLTLTQYLPDKYPIPSSDITLHYRNTGLIHMPKEIAALLAKSLEVVNYQISINGPQGLLVRNAEGDQRWGHSVRMENGEIFWIWIVNFRPYRVSWGDVRFVLEGLGEVCKDSPAVFEVELASGIRIGEGVVDWKG